MLDLNPAFFRPFPKSSRETCADGLGGHTFGPQLGRESTIFREDFGSLGRHLVVKVERAANNLVIVVAAKSSGGIALTLLQANFSRAFQICERLANPCKSSLKC